MLEFAQSQKETVAIVADAVDRFQRSFKESVLIDELRRKGVVELHFCREAMVINKEASSSDILRWDFQSWEPNRMFGRNIITERFGNEVPRHLGIFDRIME